MMAPVGLIGVGVEGASAAAMSIAEGIQPTAVAKSILAIPRIDMAWVIKKEYIGSCLMSMGYIRPVALTTPAAQGRSLTTVFIVHEGRAHYHRDDGTDGLCAITYYVHRIIADIILTISKSRLSANPEIQYCS